MRRLSLYVDSSVWNMQFDDHAPDLQRLTIEFMSVAKEGVYEIFVSEVVIAELSKAPSERRPALRSLLESTSPSMLLVDEEVSDLANSYIRNAVMPPSARADAFHLALATVHGLDVLVSWNYRHLANVRRRMKVLSHNMAQGYSHPLEIVTPAEVIDDAQD